MKKPFEVMGNISRDAIKNFMKAFPDYEIEYIIADLQLKPNPLQSKGSLQVKMKKKP